VPAVCLPGPSQRRGRLPADAFLIFAQSPTALKAQSATFKQQYQKLMKSE
jgi:hypothetical protein